LSEIHIGQLASLKEEAQTIVYIENLEIGVFRLGDDVYAYENRCPHQGGPSCEGRIIPRVEAILDTDQTSIGERFSDTAINFVCPWHGWEYDMRTGQNIGNPKIRVRKFDVIKRDGEVYLRIDVPKNK
jgi:nitrite reductase/ring-hydroxylating ferredoxin subunit